LPRHWIWISAATGVELVPVMRRDAHLTRLPIVVLSPLADIEHQLASRQAGGDDYRVKPVDARLLVTAVLARARPFR
jgi:DNA-binding response OmpR family regulator